jgi:hypothetical protein
VLLWQEQVPFPTPSPIPLVDPVPTAADADLGAPLAHAIPEECNLHLHLLEGNGPDSIIGSAYCDSAGFGGFGGYAVAGDQVAWTAADAPAAAGVYLYTRRTGTVCSLAAQQGDIPRRPLLDKEWVIWAGNLASAPGEPSGSALLGYQLATRQVAVILAPAGVPIHPEFLLNGQTVVYTLDRIGGPPAPGIYAVDLPAARPR